jgi:hypothetical protein
LYTFLRHDLGLHRLHLRWNLRMHLPHNHPRRRLNPTTHYHHGLLCRHSRRRLLMLHTHRLLLVSQHHRLLIRQLLPTTLLRLSTGRHHTLRSAQPLLLLREPLLKKLLLQLLLLGCPLHAVGHYPRHPPIHTLLVPIIMRHLLCRRHRHLGWLLHGRWCLSWCLFALLMLHLGLDLGIRSLGLRRRNCTLHLLSLHLMLSLNLL